MLSYTNIVLSFWLLHLKITTILAITSQNYYHFGNYISNSPILAITSPNYHLQLYHFKFINFVISTSKFILYLLHQTQHRYWTVLLLAIRWSWFVLLLVFLLFVFNFWGMFVRVYPRIVQGLTFLNSVKHITKILYLLYKLMPFIVESIGCYI